MTLVVSFATHDYIVQVSDRRVGVIYPDGRYELRDDNRNKGILFSSLGMFSFAGHGIINGKPTDEWAALIINQAAGIAEACELLAKSATEAFKTIRVNNPVEKFHEFVAMSWGKLNGDLVPAIYQISNSSRDEKGIITLPIQKRFTVKRSVLSKDLPFMMRVSGDYSGMIDNDPNNVHRIKRFVETCAKKRLGPQPITRLIVTTMHQVADKYYLQGRETVGKNLLVVSIPKSVVIDRESQSSLHSLVIPGRIFPNLISSLWISPDTHHWQHLPILVAGNNGVVLSNVQGGNSDSPNSITSKMKP